MSDEDTIAVLERKNRELRGEIAELKKAHNRLRVECEAWRSGRLWKSGLDYGIDYGSRMEWYESADDAVDEIIREHNG